MKALSFWNPYPALIIWGEKEWETRSRRMNYRGFLAVHAALRDDWRTQWAIGQLIPYSPRLKREEMNLAYGAVLGIVNVLDCQPVEHIYPYITQRERTFGNYNPGRWAIRMAVVEVFDNPIRATGHQGEWLWERPSA